MFYILDFLSRSESNVIKANILETARSGHQVWPPGLKSKETFFEVSPKHKQNKTLNVVKQIVFSYITLLHHCFC